MPHSYGLLSHQYGIPGGKKTKSVTYFWSQDSKAFELARKTTIKYKKGVMRSYDYTGQLFDRVISKGKTRYNPKGMTTLVEAWTFNQKWEISTAYRWDYTFDENGRLIESVLEAYQDDAYKLKFRDEYAYSND